MTDRKGDAMGAPVVHFEIMGGEGSELEAFYRELSDGRLIVITQ